MKRTILTITLLVLLAFQGYTQTTDESKKLEILHFLTSMSFKGAKPDVNPVNEVIKPAFTYSKTELEKRIELYKNSFYFSPSMFEGDEFRLENDEFHLSEHTDFIKKVNFTKAINRTNKNVIDLERTQSKAEEFKSSFRADTKPTIFIKDDSEDIFNIQGILELKYPANYHSVAFNTDEVGITKTYKNVSLTLIAIKNDLAIVKCRINSGDDPQSQLKALNKNGKELANSNYGSGPSLIYNALNAEGKIDPAKEKVLFAKFSPSLDSLLNNPNYKPADPDLLESVMYVKATGVVNSVQIDFPENIITKQIEITALPFADFKKKNPIVVRSRYQESKPFQYQDLTTDALIKSIKIKSSRSEAIFGLNAPGIEVQLPEWSNTLYAKAEFKNIKVLKAGKPVRFTPQNESLDEEKKTITFRMDHPSGMEEKVISYDQVSGEVIIKYPLRIKTLTVNRNNTDTTLVKFKNNYSIGWVQSRSDEDDDHVVAVRAFDDKNLPLYKNQGAEYYNEYTIENYWGKIKYVELDIVEEWTKTRLPFKLTPAPLLKKDYAVNILDDTPVSLPVKSSPEPAVKKKNSKNDTLNLSVPNFENIEVIQYCKDYAAFIKEYITAAKSENNEKLSELSKKALELGQKGASVMAKVKPDEFKKLTDFMTAQSKIMTDAAMKASEE